MAQAGAGSSPNGIVCDAVKRNQDAETRFLSREKILWSSSIAFHHLGHVMIVPYAHWRNFNCANRDAGRMMELASALTIFSTSYKRMHEPGYELGRAAEPASRHLHLHMRQVDRRFEFHTSRVKTRGIPKN